MNHLTAGKETSPWAFEMTLKDDISKLVSGLNTLDRLTLNVRNVAEALTVKLTFLYGELTVIESDDICAVAVGTFLKFNLGDIVLSWKNPSFRVPNEFTALLSIELDYDRVKDKTIVADKEWLCNAIVTNDSWDLLTVNVTGIVGCIIPHVKTYNQLLDVVANWGLPVTHSRLIRGDVVSCLNQLKTIYLNPQLLNQPNIRTIFSIDDIKQRMFLESII